MKNSEVKFVKLWIYGEDINSEVLSDYSVGNIPRGYWTVTFFLLKVKEREGEKRI